MPTDKSGRQSQDNRPRVGLNLLASAGVQLGDGTKKGEARAAKERERIDKIVERRERLAATYTGQRTLKREAKAEKDKQVKAERRSIAKQLGLKADSQAPVTRGDRAKQRANADAAIERINKMKAGVDRKTKKDSRAEARVIRDAIEKGPIVGRDDRTGKPIRDASQAGKVFGADTQRVLDAAKKKIGKSYSGTKEKKGVYAERSAPARTDSVGIKVGGGGRGRAGVKRDYVGPKKGAGDTTRSKLFIGPKRPRGRPTGGGKNKAQ